MEPPVGSEDDGVSAAALMHLVDVGFVVAWSVKDRARFAVGFREALEEALRRDDPAPLVGYVQVMSTRRSSIERPSGVWNAAEHEELLPGRVRRPATS